MKKGAFLFFIFILAIIIASLGVNSISVVSDYLVNDTMALTTGESKIYSIRLQNPTNDEVGIKLDYDNSTMRVIDYKGIYTLSPKEAGYRINFNVTAPKVPGIYKISYTVSEVEPSGGGGGLPIRLKINRSFNLKAVKNPKNFYINNDYVAYAAIILVFLAYIFWKKRSNKHLEKKPLKKKITGKRTKNRKRIYCFLVLFLALGILIAYGQSGIGVGLQLTDASGPIVNLQFPLNNSGNTHGNMTFFYNASDLSNVDNCSLIINNRINLTKREIAKDAVNYFQLNDTPGGSYNWSINCTDGLGNAGESARRFNMIIIITNFNGTVTNLSAVNITNVAHFVVETLTYGKINFSEGLDLTQAVDFNKYANISFNSIGINSTAIPVLNKSATLQLDGLTFTNPRILRDGAVCSSDICTKISYSGGTLIFNVTQFSVYSSEETPAETPSPSPSSSGGGGGGGTAGGGGGITTTVTTDFSVDKITLKVTLKQGENKTEILTIKNIGTSIFDVNVDFGSIGKFKVFPELNEVVARLAPNEEKPIELVFKALENEKPDIYTGKILLKGPKIQKELPAIIEVDSAQPLFDVDVDVLPSTKTIYPGDELLLEVNLFNVRGFGRVDVGVEYSIKDLNGALLATEHETVAVETQAKFTRSILVPSDLNPGNYVTLARVTYGDSVGTSSALFEVKAKSIRLYPVQLKDYKFILIIGAAVLLFGIVAFSAYQFGHLKKKLPQKPEEQIKQIKEDEKTQKLKKELQALEEARKTGFISDESYQKGKQRIEDKLKSMKL